MSQQKLSIDDIKALAAEVRLIKDFSENHNFNSGLINASVSPAAKPNNDTDWPLITALGAAIVLIIALVVYNFAGELSQNAVTAFFVVCLLLGGIATMAVHNRFENLTLTLIAGGVLLSAMLIGCGVFTPQEAVSEAKSYMHNKADKDKNNVKSRLGFHSQHCASAPKPNWAFNADAKACHAYGIFMGSFGTLRASRSGAG